MIKYIRSFSFEIKKKRRIHLFYRDFMTFASNGNVYQKIARNDKFYLIYITSVSLVLMIINELSLFLSLSLEETRNHHYKRKVDVLRFKIGCKTMQISFKLVSSSVSQIKKLS